VLAAEREAGAGDRRAGGCGQVQRINAGEDIYILW